MNFSYNHDAFHTLVSFNLCKYRCIGVDGADDVFFLILCFFNIDRYF